MDGVCGSGVINDGGCRIVSHTQRDGERDVVVLVLRDAGVRDGSCCFRHEDMTVRMVLARATLYTDQRTCSTQSFLLDISSLPARPRSCPIRFTTERFPDTCISTLKLKSKFRAMCTKYHRNNFFERFVEKVLLFPQERISERISDQTVYVPEPQIGEEKMLRHLCCSSAPQTHDTDATRDHVQTFTDDP